jgi:hypothetical protein
MCKKYPTLLAPPALFATAQFSRTLFLIFNTDSYKILKRSQPNWHTRCSTQD